jgi:hypothetical protein
MVLISLLILKLRAFRMDQDALVFECTINSRRPATTPTNQYINQTPNHTYTIH